MKIGEVFERDPTRLTDYVVKVSLQDRKDVGNEVEEYVVTPQIRKDIDNIIDGFLESRQRRPSDVCSWISGFFGSGKSHFLKIIGYVLANKEIELSNTDVVGAAEYFCKKHDLEYGPILSKELKTRSIFINLLDDDTFGQNGPGITRIIYRTLLRETGFSDVFWIAEIEKDLRSRGVWEAFLSSVSAQTGSDWTRLRETARARSALVHGLMDVLPEDYSDITLAQASIDDVKHDFKIEPSRLAKLLYEEALNLDPETGRIVLLLDEVGLYVGENADRLAELDILPEMISQHGNGKVWLFVTAQEAPEEILPRIAKQRGQFEKIRDRFPMKYQLVPENIDTVVKQRLLDKTSLASDKIRKLFDDYSGVLSMAATIKHPTRLEALLTHVEREDFRKSYPLLPYHVRLIQQILGLIRSQGGIFGEMTGRERAVLSVVQSLLVNDFSKGKLIDGELGKLATFDLVYDAIEEELKAIGSEQQSIIGNDIAKLGQFDYLRIADVAKALFLLQQVRDWVPCTLENIAAVLYPQLGTNRTSHENLVGECIKKLTAEQWISSEEGNYRFLTEVERSFDQEVNEREPFVLNGDKRTFVIEKVKSDLKEYGTCNYRTKAFDVIVEADNEVLTSKGYIKLEFFSPYYAANDPTLETRLFRESLDHDDTLYWISEAIPEFEQAVTRIIATKQVLGTKQNRAQSREEQKALDRPTKNLIALEEDLERKLRRGTQRGKLIHVGEEQLIENSKDASEIVKAKIRDIIQQIFTEFELAAVQVIGENELIRKILGWTGSPLPSVFRDLELIDDKNEILTDRPVASQILSQVRQRDDRNNTGQDISAFFEEPPYGWDPRVIRLVLATLFWNGTINVELNGRVYESPSEAGSFDAFTAIKFRTAHFQVAKDVPADTREKIKNGILELFGEGSGNAIDEIDSKLTVIIDRRLPEARDLSGMASALDIATSPSILDFLQSLQRIKDMPSRHRRLFGFLEEYDSLKSTKPSFSSLKKFAEDGKINEYKEITAFTSSCSEALISADAQHDAEIRKLQSDMRSVEFVERWSAIRDVFERLRESYKRYYTNCHKKLDEEVNRALQSLRQHESFNNGLARNQDLEPLTRLLCQVASIQGLDETPYRCAQCDKGYFLLRQNLQSVSAIQAEISNELDKRCGKSDVPIEALVIDRSLVSSSDIQKTINEIKLWSENQALQHKKVRILVKMEVMNGQDTPK
jgi:hypothetical protein